MFKKIFNSFKNLDKLTMVIMKNGLVFCFILSIISLIVLITYDLSFTSPFLYTVGLGLFKLSLIFGIEFIICGLAVDGIKKQII